MGQRQVNFNSGIIDWDGWSRQKNMLFENAR
jgi:hypothetical protein